MFAPMGVAEGDALLGDGAGPVPGWTPTSRRAWRDTWWLYWWLANFATALAWGASLAAAVPAGDPATHLQAYSTCNGAGASRRRLLAASDPAKQLGATAAVLAVASAFAAVAVGVGSVRLLRDESVTKFCVYGAIAAQARLHAAQAPKRANPRLCRAPRGKAARRAKPRPPSDLWRPARRLASPPWWACCACSAARGWARSSSSSTPASSPSWSGATRAS